MNIVEVKDNKNCIVKKHNDLVNKARYSLSEDGIKLVSMLIAMIRTDDETFQEYHIKVSDFAKLKGSNSKNNYESVHKIIKELLSCPIKIGNLQANFIASGEYKEGTATAVFEISQKLKPYLLELKKDFLEYDLKDILSLKSGYVIRLYEMIVQQWREYKHYNKNAKSFTFDFDIEEMRTLFEIPDSYRYNDVKRIIDKAQQQFKEKTNITFDYEEYKIGRAVKRLKITVRENNKGSNDILASRKAFINYIRETYKPNPDKNHFPVVINTKSGDVKVNLNGEIYLSGNDDVKTYDNKQADKLWDWLYELVKENTNILNNPNEENLLQ
uniref:Initiator RepB protein family n=1 Tax=Aliarcobacter butzleri TaxID=28197 RepID=C5H432_9BACT|nr:replication initiation protein [Aliarcobacter butzleri]ACH58605.1 initiator RepB protein family [Aliarcobacter butzleri]